MDSDPDRVEAFLKKTCSTLENLLHNRREISPHSFSPMSKLPEISSLFAAVASNLPALDPSAGNEVDLSIANLNRSLNLSEASRTRILDTALSRMCFTAPQVYGSAVEFTVRTMVSVLSYSVQCKVLMNDKEKVLRVGGLISERDCVGVMEACDDILRNLDGHKGDLCDLLLHSVIRVAALARSFPHEIPSVSKMNFRKSGSSALAKLVCYLPNQFTIENGEIPSRLLLWQMDPMILKQDISQILREIIKRPFLSLSSEIYNRIDWKSKIICLVLSPSMFIETRAFLHNWFLRTGLASIMELQTEFVGQALDIISRPIWWGISTEIGSKLPFSHAYFPHEHNLSRILSGPICQDYFKLLLCKISGSISHAGGRKTTTKINSVDHKSTWATVMNFPGWFFFATMLLFSNNNPAENLMRESAAKFIAWILNPFSESDQSLVVDCLVRASNFLTLKCPSSRKKNEGTRIYKESRRRLQLYNKVDILTSREPDSWTVSLWLKEFQDMYSKISGTKIGFVTSNIKGLCPHQNLLFRRIPLGVLFAGPNCLSTAECSLLLHYAASGTIIQKSSNSMQYSGTSQKRWKCGSEWDSETWVEMYTKVDAIRGCKTVFDVTDIAASVYHPLFETEEEGMNSVCQLKMRMCSYLLRCVEKLLQTNLDEDGAHMKSDLLTRIIRWRRQGKDDPKHDKDLDRVCHALNVKIASS